MSVSTVKSIGVMMGCVGVALCMPPVSARAGDSDAVVHASGTFAYQWPPDCGGQAKWSGTQANQLTCNRNSGQLLIAMNGTATLTSDNGESVYLPGDVLLTLSGFYGDVCPDTSDALYNWFTNPDDGCGPFCSKYLTGYKVVGAMDRSTEPGEGMVVQMDGRMEYFPDYSFSGQTNEMGNLGDIMPNYCALIGLDDQCPNYEQMTSDHQCKECPADYGFFLNSSDQCCIVVDAQGDTACF